MTAADADTPHNSVRSDTQPRRRLLTAAAIAGLLFVFITTGPSVLAPFSRVQAGPALATAEDRSFPVLATASGVLQLGNRENVNFTIAGQVETITARVGATITPGEILATLNDTSQQAELNAAKYALSAAQAATAQEEASGSSAQVSQARARMAQAQVGVIKADQDLAATVLRAPESGTVLAVNGVPDVTVSAGNSGFTDPAINGGSAIADGFIVVGNSTSFDFWALFSQTEDVQITAGQAAIVTVDPIPGLALNAKAYSIETSATQVGGVPEYYTEVMLTSSDPRLRNGQTGSVSVTVASANNVLSVPSTVLFTGANDATQVDVWSGGQVYSTTVQIGLVGSTLTQITSGLIAGEQVLLSPTGQVVLPSSTT